MDLFTNRAPNPEQARALDHITGAMQQAAASIDELPESRFRSLADDEARGMFHVGQEGRGVHSRRQWRGAGLMQLATIEMDRAAAREKFLEYRRSVRARHDAEDEQIMRGYKALANGHQVIDLPATIRAGCTVDVTYRAGLRGECTYTAPALAVMRADAPWCRVDRTPGGAVTFYGRDREGWSRSPRSNEIRYVIHLPAGTMPAAPRDACPDFNLRAMVPPVPPGLRPADNLGNYHVLWEAEWRAVAPRDPALLRHIGGDLYAVVAVWDLTDLERTVLSARFH